MYSNQTAFSEEPYKNDLDQVLQPGDDVVMVASGYAHSVEIRKGKYLGVRKNLKGLYGDKDKVASVTCEYERKFTRYNYNLPSDVRYQKENIQRGVETAKTNLYLGRVYKIDTNAWDIST